MCRKCWKKLKDIILQDSNVACNSRTNHSLSNCIEQSFQQKWESWYTLATYLLLRFLAWLWFRRRSRRLVLVFRKLWLCFTLCTLKGKSTYIASSRTCLCLHHIIFVCFTWNALFSSLCNLPFCQVVAMTHFSSDVERAQQVGTLCSKSGHCCHADEQVMFEGHNTHSFSL